MILNFMIFIGWTLYLYLCHRLVHVTPIIKNFHRHHHVFILTNQTSWKWNNLFLYNDDIVGTIDLWITDVLPTILFCFMFDSWYILLFYWCWAALLQEKLEHNPNVNVFGCTFGKWHLEHHRTPNKNFGLFFPVWDKIFKTESKKLN